MRVQALQDCAVRLPAQPSRGHVESWFLKANQPEGDLAFWFRYTLFVPLAGRPCAGVWAVLFDARSAQHRATKRTFPLHEVELGREPFRFSVGDNLLEPGHAAGTLRCGDGAEIAWELRYRGDAPPLHLLPSERLYASRLFPRSKALSPLPDATFDGLVRMGEREIRVAGWPGMLGHNWGREHAHRYAWGHCNAFEGAAGSVFEGASARVKLGPITLPWATLLLVRHEGREYDFRGVRHWFGTHCEVGLYRWRFEAASRRARLRGELACEARDLVGLRYAQPDGGTSHCLNSKIARIRLELLHPDGEPIATLRSPDKAALELLVPEPGHGLPVYC